MLLLYPSLLALLYTFGLPYLQYKVDYYKFRNVDLARLREKHRSQRTIYKSQKVTSKAQAESAPEYWKDKLTRDLNNWDQQREGLLSDIKGLRADRDALQKDRDAVQKDRDALHKDRELVMKDKDAIQNDRDHVVAERDSLSQENGHLASQVQLLAEQHKEYEVHRENLNTQIQTGTEQLTSVNAQLAHIKIEHESSLDKIESLEDEIDKRSSQIDSLSSHIVSMEKVLLAYNLSIETSDSKIESDLQKDLSQRVGISNIDIDVIADSYSRRVMQYRVPLRSYQPMLENIKRSHEERKNRAIENSPLSRREPSKAVPLGVSVFNNSE
jgi:chromosome segregation ATPase